MDDIQEKISRIMSDPEALKEVQNLGRMLGLNPDAPSAAPPQSLAENSIPPEMLSKLTQLMPLLGSMNQEDDTTRLLAALRPFLSEEKRRRLESAKRMLQLMKLLPALKSGGLFDFF